MTVHLARCADCYSFQEDAEGFTSLLRSAPLEQVPWPVGSPVHLPRHRVHFRALAQIASVASVVVVATGTIGLVHELPHGGTDTALGSAPRVGHVLGDDSIRSLRRDALVEGSLQVLPVSSTAPIDPVKPALPVIG